jgi:hypothetical protein
MIPTLEWLPEGVNFLDQGRISPIRLFQNLWVKKQS